MLTLATLTVFLALCLPYVYYISKARTRKRLPLPPGPRPWPIFGNIFDVPADKPWVTYRAWSEKYGKPRHYVFLGDVLIYASILDLMEGRSKLYADRRWMVMDELLGWKWNLGLMPYGTEWRIKRRAFHQHFNQQAVKQYHSIQTRETRRFLKRAATMCSGDNTLDRDIVSQTYAATILNIIYGMRIQDFSDEFISLSRRAVESVNNSRMPGRFWVEYFPWLRYLPSWVPVSSARKFADEYKYFVDASHNKAFDALRDDFDNIAAAPSIAQKFIRNLSNRPQDPQHCKQDEQVARDVTGVAYGAAVDTQFAATSYFLLAMMSYPDVQQRAQEELDTVVGAGRLPTMEDIDSLPFIQAILLEVLRWLPILPLGIAHSVLEDDEYKGYRIPAGTVIVANTWAMLQDPVEYRNPEVFNPDRFLRDGALNPDVRSPVAAFGYGRRQDCSICPGRHLANDALSLMIASILYVFNVEPNEDVSQETTTGFFSYAFVLRM
ncbi:hypothetical protein NM688_g2302 [Phlebia brevispora]|uniref:Uncharacterized protein n=1 Tax=Phlebia brevispora TaxID=194682 RepID=A0ACC1T8Z3_9APHY|nr:hypothetical protein NM688_g2302 [Phlebia brevispora]